MLVMAVGLGCVGFAALAVTRSVRTNREVAERAQVGYAKFALWSYREHLAESLRAAAREALGAVNHGDAVHVSLVIPSATDLGHYLPYDPACGCHVPRFGPLPSVFYGFTIGSDTIGVGPNFAPDPLTGWDADPLDGAPLVDESLLRLPEAEGRWLSAELTSAARDGYSEWGYRVHVASWRGEPRFFVSTLMPTSRGDTIMYALEYSSAAVDTLLNRVFDDPALLPIQSSLASTGASLNREVLSLEVRTPEATPLLSWAVPDRWHATPDRMPASYGGLLIRAEIVPAMIDRIVIGGLPATRTPILLGLLALAVGLTAVAGVQLRREVRFARARTEFVASVSHELRTPLTQVRLVLDTLRMHHATNTEARDRGIATIDREVLRLQHLVDGVLRFRDGEVPVTEAVRVSLDVGAEVRQVVTEFAPLAAARDVAIHLDTAQAPTVRMDPGALRQVLLNLLDNAVKYGPRGQVIAVSVRPAGTRTLVVVADGGPGIPPEERERIWHSYQRGSAATSQAIGGSGIGLTVVADIVRRHGGTVTIDAPPGGGARFTVDLPGEAT